MKIKFTAKVEDYLNSCDGWTPKMKEEFMSSLKKYLAYHGFKKTQSYLENSHMFLQKIDKNNYRISNI